MIRIPSYKFPKRILALVLVAFALAGIIALQIVLAANPYPASDEIGHTPQDFTVTDANNGGSVSAIGFSTPIGTVIDLDHHWLFVADADNNRVVVFDLDSDNELIDGTADHVIGQSTLSGSDPGTGATELHYPTALGYDIYGYRLFVSDNQNDRVQVFDFSGGTITDGVAAAYTFGSGSATPPSASSLNSPNGLSYDPGYGLLYVADTLDDRVVAFDARPSGSGAQNNCGVSTTGIVSLMNASCVLGEPDFVTINDSGGSGDIDPGAAFLNNPISVFMDTQNYNLYVSSDNISVRVFDLSGGISNGQSASHYLGADFTTLYPDYVVTTSAHDVFGPRGMAMDYENHILFLADSYNQRVLGFDVSSIVDGEDAVSLIGAADFTFNTGGSVGQTILNEPQAISWDPISRNQFVVDSLNNRVMLFKTISLDAGATPPDAPIGSPYSLPFPTSNSQGTVTFELMSDPSSISSGWSIGAGGITGTTIATGVGTFDFYIRAVDTTASGSVFYSNWRAYSVPIIQGDNGSAYVASDEIGHDPLNFTLGDQNNDQFVPLANGLYTPTAVAVDTTHHWLFVAEGDNNRVSVFDLDSNNELIDRTADHVLGQEDLESGDPQLPDADGMHYPDGLVYDNVHSRLFVSDGADDRVMVFDLSGGTITDGMNSSYILGGAGAIAANKMNHMNGMAYDPTNDRLYVADSSFNRVTVFDVRPNGSPAQSLCGVIASGIATGMNASCVLGEPNFTTANGGHVVSETRLTSPIALLLDEDNHLLYVTDNADNRVLIFDVASISNGEAAVHVLGATDFLTAYDDPDTDPGLTDWSFYDPRGMYLDTENHILFISDTNHNRVLGFDVATITDGESAMSVIGQAGFTTAVFKTSDDGFTHPQWSAWLPEQRYHYIGDAGNQRVMFFKYIRLDATSVADGTTGVAYSAPLDTSNSQGTVSFEVVSGALPSGVTLDGTGLTGTPTVAGSYSFTLRAVDNFNASSVFYSNHESYSMTVAVGTGGTGGSSSSSGSTGSGGNPPADCDDGLDNDGDTFTDYPNDPGCASTADNNEYNAPSSGSGGTTTGTGTTGGTTTSGTTGGTTGTGTSGGTTSGTTTGGVTGGIGSTSGTGTGSGTNGNTGTTGGTGTGAGSATTGTGTSGTTGGTSTPTDTPSGGGSSSGCQTTYSSGLGGISGTIIDGVITSWSTVGCVLSATYEKLKTASNILSTLGVVVAGISSIATVLFLNPFSFSEIALLPMRIWSLLMSAFGLKKRNRPWGVVYDSVTKQPLDPVYVILQDLEGKEVASSITDIDGRYGFFVNKGVYKMLPSKPNYYFASKLLSGKNRDELYGDLYFGDYFEVKQDGEVITKNIPMDPLKFDWNEFAKRDRKLMRFYSKWDFVFARIATFLFGLGFIVATVAIVTAPTLYNKIIFALYIVMFIFRLFGVTPTKLGSVAKAQNGDPLSYAVVHLISPTTGVEVGKKVANKYGKFYFLAPKGEYILKIDEKNLDQSYTSLQETNVTVEKGVLNKNLKV